MAVNSLPWSDVL